MLSNAEQRTSADETEHIDNPIQAKKHVGGVRAQHVADLHERRFRRTDPLPSLGTIASKVFNWTIQLERLLSSLPT